MALIRDEYWLKLAGKERNRETRESIEIMEGGKECRMGFKPRNKVLTRNRECSARVGRGRADDCGGVVCQEQRIYW